MKKAFLLVGMVTGLAFGAAPVGFDAQCGKQLWVTYRQRSDVARAHEGVDARLHRLRGEAVGRPPYRGISSRRTPSNQAVPVALKTRSQRLAL